MGKEVKTNVMRILDRNKVPYEILNYECDEFIDGLHTAQATGAPVEQSFKNAGGEREERRLLCLCDPHCGGSGLKSRSKSGR